MFASEVALHTTKRLLARMFQQVYLEVNLLFSAIITLCAIKRLLATLSSGHMRFKIGGYSALVAALVAIGGLFSVILELLGKFCQFYCLRLSTAFSRCQ